MKVDRTQWEVHVTVRAHADELVDLLEFAAQHDLAVDPHLVSSTTSGKAGYRVTLMSKGNKTAIQKGIAGLTGLQSFLDKVQA